MFFTPAASKRAVAGWLVALVIGLSVLGAFLHCSDNVISRNRYAGTVPYGSSFWLPWHHQQFRILQISDPQVESVWDKCKDVDSIHHCGTHNTSRFISRAISFTNPDFVVVTGDLVFGPRSPVSAFQAVLLPLDRSSVPYATIFGNHDVQRCSKWDEHESAAHLRQRSTLHGTSKLMVGNGQLCVWMIDYSHTYAGWVNPAHLAWIRNDSSCRNAGASLAFTHFPVALLRSNIVGSLNEPIDWPRAPSELLQTLHLLPSLKVVGFGHDHTNTACGTTPDGLTGCYAGSAGYTTYGDRNVPRQARVYDIYKNYRVFTFRVLDGQSLQSTEYHELQ